MTASRLAALVLGLAALGAGAVVLGRYQAEHPFHAYGFAWFRALGPGEGGFYLRYLILGAVAAALLGHGLVPLAASRRSSVSFAAARAILTVAAAAAVAVVAAWVLRSTVVTDDENVYRLQADMLRHGRAAWPAPDLAEFFGNVFVTTREGRWFGQYPPGQPLLLAPFEALGWPRLLPVLLAAANLWLTMSVARAAAGPAAGVVSGVLLLASPLFVLTSGTLLSHAAAYAGLALAAWAALRLRAADSLAGGLALGGGLGLAVITRPYTGVTLGAVLGVAALIGLVRARRARGLAAAGVALAVAGAGFLAYNAAITGDPLVTGYQAVRRPGQVELGFGPIAAGVDPHTPALGVRNALRHAVRFQFWSLGWPLAFAPLLGLAALRHGGAASLPVRAATGTAAAMIGVGLVSYVAYWSLGVCDTGPVKLFELVLPAVVLGAVGAGELARRAGPPRAAAAVAASILVAAVLFWPGRIGHLRELTARIRVPIRAVESAVEPPAYVFVGSFQPREAWSWVYGRPNPDPGLDDPVIYIRDGGAYNAQFLARYPGRRAYRLRFEGERPVLTRLDAGGMETP